MSYLDLLVQEIAAGRPVAVAKLIAAPAGLGPAPGQSVVVGPGPKPGQPVVIGSGPTSGQPVVVGSGPTSGQPVVVGPGSLLGGWVSHPSLQTAMADAAVRMLAEGRPGTLNLATSQGPARVYVESYLPAPVLVIIGAGHVGQMVAQVGALAGFQVIVLDDRPQYANPERFPTANRIICGPLPRVAGALELGPRHYVVLMTRGHHQDRECLRQIIRAPVPYLGMIGSRTRIQTIYNLLRADGVDQALLDRIRAPIGLDIGARTPAEIAIAVLAEIIAVRRGGTGAPLSQLDRSLVHGTREPGPVETALLTTLAEARRAGEPVALATIINTRGHAPREVGAKMLVWRDGRTAGSVGGGCGENSVRLQALTALDARAPMIHQVDLLDDPALEEGAVCGGVMEVLIEPFPT